MRRRNILIGTLAIAVVVATIGGVAYVLHTRAPGRRGIVSGPARTRLRRVSRADATAAPPPGMVALASARATTARRHSRSRMCGTTWRMGRSWARDGVTGKPTVTRVVFLTISDLDPRVEDPKQRGIMARRLPARYARLLRRVERQIRAYPEIEMAARTASAPSPSCSMRTPATQLVTCLRSHCSVDTPATAARPSTASSFGRRREHGAHAADHCRPLTNSPRLPPRPPFCSRPGPG